MTAPRLHDLLRSSAQRHPEGPALLDASSGSGLSFAELDRASDEVAEHLRAGGVRAGDRVALLLPKTLASVVVLYGVLKAGAAYVPVDATAPANRSLGIVRSSGAPVVVTLPSLWTALSAEGAVSTHQTTSMTLPPVGSEAPILAWLEGPPAEPAETRPDLAYILFTSGSTGTPKGVVHTHASALAFVHWARSAFDVSSSDRFASHAPFHFDLSIFDLFVSMACGAPLVLIDSALGRNPTGLAEATHRLDISVWYSTPSTLRMLLAWGKLERFGYPRLRHVLYAGEVFSAGQLRELAEHWPAPRFANLYGPTETNVCTWFAVPKPLDPTRAEPYPIGVCCSDDAAIVVHPDGTLVEPGQQGELCIRGGSVMLGYWNQPELTAAAFLTHTDGQLWYRTGDLVEQDAEGNYLFRGRRDRMVKRFGYRIELGEIENALVAHESVLEAALVARPDESQGVMIHAYVTTAPGPRISTVAFKRHCARHLPRYMIPDRFHTLASMPRTSSGKVAYRELESSS